MSYGDQPLPIVQVRTVLRALARGASLVRRYLYGLVDKALWNWLTTYEPALAKRASKWVRPKVSVTEDTALPASRNGKVFEHHAVGGRSIVVSPWKDAAARTRRH